MKPETVEELLALNSETKDLLLKVRSALHSFCEEGTLFDFRGHCKDGKMSPFLSWRDARKELRNLVDDQLLLGSWRPEGLQEILAAVEEAKELDAPISLRKTYSLRCPYCAEYAHLGFNGLGLVWIGDRCRHSEGIVTEFELNVPSGKIVVDDDLRPWFPVDEKHDVNAMIGCHLSSLAAAKVGMAYGFVGNTCPHVYCNEGDRFVIGSYREEIWDSEKKEYFDNPDGCPWGEDVASICTDLWWYSIADYDDFVRRVAHYTPDKPLEEILGHWTFHVVDVRPGVYRFRQDQGVDRDAPVVEYATFEWVREPDPVRDLLKEDAEKTLTASESLIARCLEWSTRHMGTDVLNGDRSVEASVRAWEGWTDEQRLRALASAAVDVMFSSRADDWHENGFPRTVVSSEVRELAAELGEEVPAFDFQGCWRSPSENYDPICLGAGLGKSAFGPFPEFAPSFVRLALNICQSAIKHGEEPRLNRDVYPPAYETPFARENMAKFVRIYRALRKKYPDIVFDEDFDLWMKETSLTQYVKEFDYGVVDPPESEWGTPPSTVKKGAFFTFDSSKLDDGYFCWAKGTWASKANAQRYAIGVLTGTLSEMGHLHVDASARLPSLIPLKAVGRVLRGTGDGHQSHHLVVAFDYGTANMRREMAFGAKDMKAVEQFDDEERYARLLKKHADAYEKLAETEKG